MSDPRFSNIPTLHDDGTWSVVVTDYSTYKTYRSDKLKRFASAETAREVGESIIRRLKRGQSSLLLATERGAA